MTSPRFELPILSAQVTGDRRSLVLSTMPHLEAAAYAITLPAAGSPNSGKARPGDSRQVAAIDLGYDLCGVQARWQPATGTGVWSGWLPHLDLAVARAFTAGSAEHDRLWRSIELPGRLTLSTQLDLWQMLRPAVQPGSSTGYTLPDEVVSLVLSGSGPIEMIMPRAGVSTGTGEDGRYRVRISVKPKERQPLRVELTMLTGAQTTLGVSYSTSEDSRARALPLRRFLLPWAALEKRSEAVVQRTLPELNGGDWGRGRALFYGEQAKCSSCHKVRSRGGEIGPDLSNLVQRDYASVLRDIHTPGAAINPDYIGHVVALTDGRVLNGTLRSEGERLIVGDNSGRQTVVDRAAVETTSPTSVSIMPDGLDTALGPERLRDLLTFLLTDPLSPAALEHDGAPPPRRRAELDAVLKGSEPVENSKRLRIVLAGGPRTTGPASMITRFGSSDGQPSCRPINP